MTAGAENLGKSAQQGDFRIDSPQQVIGPPHTLDTPHRSQQLIGAIDPTDSPRRRTRVQPTQVLPIRNAAPSPSGPVEELPTNVPGPTAETAVFVPEVQGSAPATVVPLIRADDIQGVEAGYVEGAMSTETIDPHEKPVTWFFGRHEEDSADELEPFKEKIIEELRTHPTDLIAVLTENITGQLPVTELQTQLVSQGMLPSEATIEAHMRIKYPDGIPPEAEHERQQMRAELDDTTLPYSAQIRALDEVCQEVGDQARRILWVEEGHDLESLRRIDALVHADRYMERPAKIDNPVEVRRTLLTLYAAGQRERNTSLVERNESVLANPDVAASVGRAGATHRGIGEQLQGSGYNATPVFTSEENGEGHIHDPETLLVLKLIEDPNAQIAPEDILLAFMAEKVTSHTHPDGTPLTTQERNKQMNAFVATTKAMMQQ